MTCTLGPTGTCHVMLYDSPQDVGTLTVTATLRMVRMVRLLAVKRSAFCDCRGKVHGVRCARSLAHISPGECP